MTEEGVKCVASSATPMVISARLLIMGPAREAKPFSHRRMVLRRFRKEVFLTGFAAEAQALMVVGDKPKLSTTVCTTVVKFGHELSSDWR